MRHEENIDDRIDTRGEKTKKVYYPRWLKCYYVEGRTDKSLDRIFLHHSGCSDHWHSNDNNDILACTHLFRILKSFLDQLHSGFVRSFGSSPKDQVNEY